MKAFEFSLRTLLDTQKTLEQVAEEKLAAALRELHAAHEKVQHLMARRNFEIEQIEALKGVRTIRHHYSTHLRFLDRITHQIAVQSQKVAVLQGKVDELRIELHAVMRERKTLEKLEEKELSLWQKEQRRLDQKEMDEFAAASYLLHRSAALPVEAALRGSKKETRK